jgi:hypothetical protein
MKLDHPAKFAFKHSAGGFGTPSTPHPRNGKEQRSNITAHRYRRVADEARTRDLL